MEIEDPLVIKAVALEVVLAPNCTQTDHQSAQHLNASKGGDQEVVLREADDQSVAEGAQPVVGLVVRRVTYHCVAVLLWAVLRRRRNASLFN